MSDNKAKTVADRDRNEDHELRYWSHTEDIAVAVNASRKASFRIGTFLSRLYETMREPP
jgi:hypothetical protein